MVLFRSIAYFIVMSLTVILFSLPMVLLVRLVSFDTISKIANSWGRLNIWALRVTCGLKHEITGWENISNQNGIVMSKHQSTWETIALRGLLPRQQTWVLKEELLKVPFFGWALRACEPIAIDRSSGRKAVKHIVDKGKAALKQGRWVVIFPEGTRVAHGEKKKYGIGGAILAEHAKSPIIPIAHNAGVFWKRRGILKYPGTIRVIVGKPISPVGKKASEITREVENWIEGQMENLPSSP